MLTQLSQSHFNLLETCPRRFQHIYLDQLMVPVTPEQQAALDWGNRFHMMMQQQELRLPLLAVDEATDSDASTLLPTVQQFVRTNPELFAVQPGVFRYSEHRRTLTFQGYLLTAVYDLLILRETTAEILDWKTYLKPPNSRWLAQNWQSRLYPFILAETSPYLPEQISLTYWFVRAEAEDGTNQPQSLTFPYSRAQHDVTKQAIAQWLTQLTHWLQQYEAGIPFPQVREDTPTCRSCSFTTRCERSDSPLPLSANVIPDVATIEEIAL
jgi:hypothetical protein